MKQDSLPKSVDKPPVLNHWTSDDVPEEVRSAVAMAVADRIVDQVEEVSNDLSRKMATVDWSTEILNAVQTGNISEELTDTFGIFGNTVEIRLKLAIAEHAAEIERIRQETEETVELQEEAKKVALENRWQIWRNGHLTRIELVLTVFSLWPLVFLIITSLSIGVFLGYSYRQNQEVQHVSR